MQFGIGILIVFLAVFGSFALMGGNLLTLNQPGEFGIILGAALGAFVISTPKHLIKETIHGIKLTFSSSKFNKDYFTDLLVLLFKIMKKMSSSGVSGIEKDIDSPSESEVFKEYSKILANKDLIEFLCDNLRIISMGVNDYNDMNDIMDGEINVFSKEVEHSTAALINVSDALPALGIVAAVLGVIKTMASIDQPPEILGKLIAGALVGTFLGVFFAYTIIGPIAHYSHSLHIENFHYLSCIKNALVSHVKGNSPSISVEIARKAIPHRLRPDFKTLEAKLYQ